MAGKKTARPRPASIVQLRKRLRPHVAPPDLDYEAAFRCLATVEARIATRGTNAARVLRRGFASMALGNYLAAALDAEWVLRGEPEKLEAQYLKGQACLAMAAVKAGVARPGIGVFLPASALPPRARLLELATDSFQRVLSQNPDDSQARKGLDAARELARRDAPKRMSKPGPRGVDTA
jgi:hypothetical protein